MSTNATHALDAATKRRIRISTALLAIVALAFYVGFITLSKWRGH